MRAVVVSNDTLFSSFFHSRQQKPQSIILSMEMEFVLVEDVLKSGKNLIRKKIISYIHILFANYHFRILFSCQNLLIWHKHSKSLKTGITIYLFTCILLFWNENKKKMWAYALKFKLSVLRMQERHLKMGQFMSSIAM